MHRLEDPGSINDELQNTGGVPCGFTLQPAIAGNEKHGEEDIKEATRGHDKQIALTRLIFRADIFLPLGKTIAMFADCPLECSECHKLLPSTLKTSPSFLFPGGYFEKSSFRNGRRRTLRYESNVCISRSRYIWGNNKRTAFDKANQCVESRKGTWCLLCWEDWHRQKRVAYEALVLKQFPYSFLGNVFESASVACDQDVVCPWLLLREPARKSNGWTSCENVWYWAPQPLSLWMISNMTATIVQRSQTTSFKDVCAQEGLMVALHNGRPTLYCAVCKEFATGGHLNDSDGMFAHKRMCSQFRFLQRRGIVVWPGDEYDEHDYTSSLLSFYQEVVLYPLDWGMDELTEKLIEIDHRRRDAAVG